MPISFFFVFCICCRTFSRASRWRDYTRNAILLGDYSIFCCPTDLSQCMYWWLTDENDFNERVVLSYFLSNNHDLFLCFLCLRALCAAWIRAHGCSFPSRIPVFSASNRPPRNVGFQCELVRRLSLLTTVKFFPKYSEMTCNGTMK